MKVSRSLNRGGRQEAVGVYRELRNRSGERVIAELSVRASATADGGPPGVGDVPSSRPSQRSSKYKNASFLTAVRPPHTRAASPCAWLPTPQFVDCFRQHVREHRWRSAWRGFRPCVSRAFPANAAGFYFRPLCVASLSGISGGPHICVRELAMFVERSTLSESVRARWRDTGRDPAASRARGQHHGAGEHPAGTRPGGALRHNPLSKIKDP